MDARAAIEALIAGRALEVVASGDGAFVIRVRQEAFTPARTGGRRRPRQLEMSEVIVTATRRESLLAHTPMSVTVLGETALNEHNLVSVRDIRRSVLGLNMTETNTGQSRITVRGLQSAGENSVGFYFDETPISAPSTATADPSAMTPDIELYDVARVEVLRGPQGTLYGAGALSGALRIIPNAPALDETFGEVQLSASAVEDGDDGAAFRGFYNLPLVKDTLALRIVGYSEERPGYVDNVRLGKSDINSASIEGQRLAVLLRVSPALELDAAVLNQSQNVDDTDYWYPEVGDRETDNYVRLPYDSDIRLHTARARWRPGDVEIVGAFSHYNWTATRVIDSTRNALAVLETAKHCALYFSIASPCTPAQDEAYRDYVRSVVPVAGVQPMEVTSQVAELRASSQLGGKIDWTFGAFFEDREDSSASSVVSADAETGLTLDPAVSHFLRLTSMKIENQALFGELTYRPTNALAVTLGLRRYTYKKQSSWHVVQTGFLNGAVAGASNSAINTDQGWVSRLNLSYEFSDNVFFYGQYAEGFRPGGANTIPGLPSHYLEYGPDTARSFEAGLRATFGDGRYDLSGAVYRVNWDDMQMSVSIPSFRFVTNLGASRIDGLELELGARLSETWSLNSGVSVNDGRLSEDLNIDDVAGEGRKGDRIPFEPRVRGFLGLSYVRDTNAALEYGFNANVVYTGSSTSDFNNESPSFRTIGDFATLDMRAWLARGDWRSDFWVSNLFDAQGELMIRQDRTDGFYVHSLRPRTFGVSVTKSF